MMRCRFRSREKGRSAEWSGHQCCAARRPVERFLPSTEPLNPNCLPEIQIVRKKVVEYPKTLVVGWWLLPRQRTTKHGFQQSTGIPNRRTSGNASGEISYELGSAVPNLPVSAAQRIPLCGPRPWQRSRQLAEFQIRRHTCRQETRSAYPMSSEPPSPLAKSPRSSL